MRRDMAKVVTEAPRCGHGNPSKKWGRRLNKDEYHSDDHGPSRAPISAHRQYGWNAREFSDVLGPLRRYLRKQVGRPWDKIWSEITRTLDSRSLTGQHIFDHIHWEVEQHARLGEDGRLFDSGRYGAKGLIRSLYVHPVTGLLCCKPKRRFRFRGGAFLEAQAALRVFGVQASTANDIRRYRLDGLRAWERRECGWFIHTYRLVPEKLVRIVTRSDGHEVPIYGTAYYERVSTKQANKREIRKAGRLLARDPLARACK